MTRNSVYSHSFIPDSSNMEINFKCKIMRICVIRNLCMIKYSYESCVALTMKNSSR